LKTYSNLIVTVGASLKGNILRDDTIKEYYLNNDLEALSEQMATNKWGDPESERKYGSEINSTVSLLRNFTQIENAKFVRGSLYLFISDTEDGRKIGTLLKNFFEQNDEFQFGSVKLIKLEGLTHEDEHKFGTKGLRNVVREFAKVTRTHASDVIVNSTGGYKAQIAFALALGQALKFPVYYRFEAFSKIIKMPPLPVSLDWEIYINNFEILEYLESQTFVEEQALKAFGYNNFAELPSEIKSFVDREKIDKIACVDFNPMGQVFIESARELIRMETPLPESSKMPKDKILYNSKEAHALEFEGKHRVMERLSRLTFVDRVHMYDFHAREKDLISVKLSVDNIIRVMYGNKKGTIYLDVNTTAKSRREMIAAVEEIKRNLV